MKKILITLIVMCLVLLTSCGESNNLDSSNSGEGDSQTISSSMTPSSATEDDAQDKISVVDAKKIIEDCFMAAPNAEAPPLLAYYDGDNNDFHMFWWVVNDEKQNDMMVVDKQTGEPFAQRLKDAANMPLDEWIGCQLRGEDPWTSTSGYDYALLPDIEWETYDDNIAQDPNLHKYYNKLKTFFSIYPIETDADPVLIYTKNIDLQDYCMFYIKYNLNKNFHSNPVGINVFTEELVAFNIDTWETMPLGKWLEDVNNGLNPWIQYKEFNGIPEAAPITAMDLIGQWIWDNTAFYNGAEDDYRQITFMSNGSCNGGVSMRYNETFATQEENILIGQYWEFLEYEQILQIQGSYYTYISATSLDKRENQAIISFKVTKSGDTLYLVNINDSSTEYVEYVKNNN